jgi:hypothetical protein
MPWGSIAFPFVAVLALGCMPLPKSTVWTDVATSSTPVLAHTHRRPKILLQCIESGFARIQVIDVLQGMRPPWLPEAHPESGSARG